MLESKIRDVFADMVVLKNPERAEFFKNLSLPSYMRDWLVMKFSDEDGEIDYDSVLRYIRQYIPSREDYEQFKFEMVNGETVRFLARVRVAVDIKTGKTMFELPDFGGAKAGGVKTGSTKSLDASGLKAAFDPVAQKKANELGLYDMSGNVDEWCLDDWVRDSNKLTPEFTRGNDGSDSSRMRRGGSWNASDFNCRSADRGSNIPTNPNDRFHALGFRVVLVPI